MYFLIRPSSKETVKIQKTTVKATGTDYDEGRGVSDESWNGSILYTSELTNELKFHAVHVSRLCKYVVVNQIVLSKVI